MPQPLSRAAVDLRAWRSRAKLNQTSAAQRIGVDQGRYSQFENGNRKPGRVLAVRIHELTGIPVHLWEQPALERVA